ncbi:MAG: Holliday junction branch migration protein RuvA [Candidatus Peribacteraceae bacterium]|nr:Holliday junction branch migration protein RuvA [Candidatus Peribacteraceae bacterium]
MIAHLHGIVSKLKLGSITIDTNGVGYLLNVPLDTWEILDEGEKCKLSVYTYVKEDRLELFGFKEWPKRELFAQMMKISGVGPSLGLELCSVPNALLSQAISKKDPSILTNIKGVGGKRAEKLLVELSSLADNHPDAFVSTENSKILSEFDSDALEALKSLGYDQRSILDVLKSLPKEVSSTEERVTEALKMM